MTGVQEPGCPRMEEGEGGPVAVWLTGPMGYNYKPSINQDMTVCRGLVAPGWRRERGALWLCG